MFHAALRPSYAWAEDTSYRKKRKVRVFPEDKAGPPGCSSPGMLQIENVSSPGRSKSVVLVLAACSPGTVV